MRGMALAIATATAFVPSTTFAQAHEAQFQGMVKGKITAGGMEVETVQYMKGSMMRIDMTVPDAGEVSQIMNVETGEALMILHSEKMWVDLSVMGRFMPGVLEASAAETEMPEIVETGETGTFAERECRYYRLIMKDGMEVKVCSVGGLGCFVPGAPAGLDRGSPESIPGLPQDAEQWIEHFADGFFILRMEAEDALYEASEIEPGSPPDELFVPPAEYREMSVPYR